MVEFSADQQSFFTRALLDWYDPDRRPLPWKHIEDPYRIWLSEVILQQTRVEQGLPYYERYLQRFPRVAELAAAREDEVLKLWEGLGYYSRARNLLAAARMVVEALDGQFPTTYQGLLQLPGVGPYTAAAIASFAYQLPHAVVDGNVYRVLARFFGLDLPVDTTSGKKVFRQLAQELLAKDQPARYNQAIMDFGATVCRPKNPICRTCPLAAACQARASQQVERLPLKSKRLQKRTRYFHYLVLEYADQVFLRQRVHKDIWRGLYDFPLIETPSPSDPDSQLLDRYSFTEDGPAELSLQASFLRQSGPYRQTLTHQRIVAYFTRWSLHTLPGKVPDNWLLVPRHALTHYAFPKIVDWYFTDKNLYLNLQA